MGEKLRDSTGGLLAFGFDGAEEPAVCSHLAFSRRVALGEATEAEVGYMAALLAACERLVITRPVSAPATH